MISSVAPIDDINAEEPKHVSPTNKDKEKEIVGEEELDEDIDQESQLYEYESSISWILVFKAIDFLPL